MKTVKYILFAVGLALLVAIGLPIIYLPCPTNTQYVFLRIILSAAIAAFTALIPGSFSFKYKKAIIGTGALGVFAFTFVYNPKILDTSYKCVPNFDFTVFIQNDFGESIHEEFSATGNFVASKGSQSLRLFLLSD
jgi:hypothetical protein